MPATDSNGRSRPKRANASPNIFVTMRSSSPSPSKASSSPANSSPRKINDLGLHGTSHIQLIIGGSLGLDPAILKRADYLLSFSKMTFPHQLMRVILLEQIYRAYKINAGEPYHK